MYCLFCLHSWPTLKTIKMRTTKLHDGHYPFPDPDRLEKRGETIKCEIVTPVQEGEYGEARILSTNQHVIYFNDYGYINQYDHADLYVGYYKKLGEEEHVRCAVFNKKSFGGHSYSNVYEKNHRKGHLTDDPPPKPKPPKPPKILKKVISSASINDFKTSIAVYDENRQLILPTRIYRKGEFIDKDVDFHTYLSRRYYEEADTYVMVNIAFWVEYD